MHQSIQTYARALKQLIISATLVAVIFMSHFAPDGHDDQRILQLAFFALFAVFVTIAGRTAGLFADAMSPLVRTALCGVLTLGVLSSATAFSPRHAFSELAVLTILLFVALCVAREVAQDRDRSLALILTACAAGCLAYAGKVILLYLAALSAGTQPGAETFAPGFSNIRFLNHAQTVTLPLLVLLCATAGRGTRGRWVWFPLAAIWWVLLFAVTGRGTFLGVTVGCAAALFLRRGHAAAYLKAMLVTALAGLVLYAVFLIWVPEMMGMQPFGLFTEVIERTVKYPTSLREMLWVRTIELIAADPWLGAGPLHYAHYSMDMNNAAHPHNWVLQIGCEWGLPALLCACLAIGSAMLGLIRSAGKLAAADARNQTFLSAWLVIGVALLVDGLVSGLIVMPVSQLLIALYIGLAAGWAWSFRPAARGATRRAPIPAALLLGCVVVLGICVAPELERVIRKEPLPAHEAAWYRPHFHPRMWLAGHF